MCVCVCVCMYLYIIDITIIDVLFLTKGHYRCQKLLLSKGASWKEKDNEGETALHLSTRHKSSKCLASLLKQLQPGEVDDQDNNKVSLTRTSSVMLTF